MTEIPTTAVAQRRFIEGLAALDRTPGGIDGMLLEFPALVAFTEQQGFPALADVWRRLEGLALSVKADLRGVAPPT